MLCEFVHRYQDFLGVCGNFLNPIRNFGNIGNPFGQPLVALDGFLNQLGLLLDVVADIFDFLRLSGTLFGKFSDFSRNNGESLAGFSGTGCLNGGVQCKQIRLTGNLVDDVDKQRVQRESADLLSHFLTVLIEFGQ